MCGISGAVVRGGAAATSPFVKHCLEDHRFRGPDHRDTMDAQVGDWGVTLGHTRLAIIDLSKAANQPMSRGARLVISYNGEIFNFVELRSELAGLGQGFETQSDTEVILAAYERWADGAFARLNGFFACAILDRSERRLVLARDRFGVKPLYYHVAGSQLLFSSTAAPIARAVGRGPNLEYLNRGLAIQCYEDGTEATQYQSVSSVLPGHHYTFELDRDSLDVRRHKYYDLPARVEAIRASGGASGDTASLVEECERRLTSAVALRLRSDVPVGVSLSGGIDSATIAALARQHHGGIVGFTFGHPGQPESEGPEVARLARHLAIDPVYVWPSAKEMADEFWSCLEGQDSPFTSGSIVAQHAVYRAARAQGVKVILGGQGGDEIFLGYRKSFLWQVRDAWRARRGGEFVAGAMGLSKVALAELPRIRSYHGALALRLGLQRGVVLGSKTPAVRRQPGGSVLERQLGDVLRGGLLTLLRYEDRNSMACSVESRLPYMDYRLVEWAIALPVNLKLTDGYAKWILRRVAARLIPSSITWRRAKRGFDVGVADWMAAGLGAAIRSELAKLATAIVAATGWRVQPCEFTDRALATDRLRFVEATTAIWLGRNLS